MLTAERERTAQLPKRTGVYCRLSTDVKAKLHDYSYCLYMLRRLSQEGLSVACVQMSPPLHSEKIVERFFKGRGRLHTGYLGQARTKLTIYFTLIMPQINGLP